MSALKRDFAPKRSAGAFVLAALKWARRGVVRFCLGSCLLSANSRAKSSPENATLFSPIALAASSRVSLPTSPQQDCRIVAELLPCVETVLRNLMPSTSIEILQLLSACYEVSTPCFPRVCACVARSCRCCCYAAATLLLLLGRTAGWGRAARG